MRKGSSFGLAAGSLAAVLASTSATAADGPADAAAADSGTQLDEIVVTARRRAESLQDVPVTVAVVNAAALETRGIHTEADLQIAIPGLTVRTSNNSNELNYVMRGESVDAYSG
jgi:iron complex outermembrane receptor protein